MHLALVLNVRYPVNKTKALNHHAGSLTEYNIEKGHIRLSQITPHFT